MIASWRGKIGWKGLIAIAVLCLLAARLWVLFGPEDADDWQLIRSYSGILDPAEGPISAKVYSFAHVGSSYTIFQNRIGVQAADGSMRLFTWPDDNLAGTACDVVDLDGDSIKEFVITTESSARVVSYRKGTFSYREKSRDWNGSDDLLSATVLEMVDLDHDGRTEFVVFGHTSLEAVGKDPPQPKVHQWTLRNGFQPGSDRLVEVYRNRLQEGHRAR